MFNILSSVGMSLQSELCLWTMLGLLRTIFDATLFKVNANLKQVWQMSMPAELSMPVQRVLRTTISGVMLVQCFTVYIYLASYIVLLYPIFLEERPALVLPWLLLAAIRKFLCEFTSLSLGLGVCVLLGPARPPCIKFVIFKVASITPAFYMWMLVFSYYNILKVAAAFKTFPMVIPSRDPNYGLELAIRRRRTKSLQDEAQLRKKLVANFNNSFEAAPTAQSVSNKNTFKSSVSSRMALSTDASFTDIEAENDVLLPLTASSDQIGLDIRLNEEGNERNEIIPRDTDRILEQFVIMLLRTASYINTGRSDADKLFTGSSSRMLPYNDLDCTPLSEDNDNPPIVGSSKGKTASYLQEYPQIFMKKTSDSQQFQDQNLEKNRTTHNPDIHDDKDLKGKKQKRVLSTLSVETISPEAENEDFKKTNVVDKKNGLSRQSLISVRTKLSEGTSLEIHSDENVQNDERSSLKSSSKKSEKYRKAIINCSTKSHNSQTSWKEPDTCRESVTEIPVPEDLNINSSERATTQCTKKAQNNTIERQDDSLQSIINRMKKNLPSSTRSLQQDKHNTTGRLNSSHSVNQDKSESSSRW